MPLPSWVLEHPTYQKTSAPLIIPDDHHGQATLIKRVLTIPPEQRELREVMMLGSWLHLHTDMELDG